MRYLSTRGGAGARLSEAILSGLAPDGGLFVPERLPQLAIAEFDDLDCDADDALATVGARVLAPFFDGDPLADALGEICAEAFNFPAPLVQLRGEPASLVLELFHGPTAAFKDFGARFLAACMRRCIAGSGPSPTVLVATSGDTGGAVAAGFSGSRDIEVAVLFPQGRVSPRQQQQLTCWGGNVRAFAVRGDFDACQRLVKEAFVDPVIARSRTLCSANSINIGRLLPQMVYYARAALGLWRSRGVVPGFIVPTGNLGNALACMLAREVGLPIGDIVLATNANRPIADFLASGRWTPRPSIATLASAMDVGNPSNMERMRRLFGDAGACERLAGAIVVPDEQIEAQIRAGVERWGQIWCPHTATAAAAYDQLAPAQRDARPWILVATAHPAKFETIVEPLIGREVPVPEALAALLALPSQSTQIAATLEALRAQLPGARR